MKLKFLDKLTLKRVPGNITQLQIKGSTNVAEFFRDEIWDEDSLDVHESFYVVALNRKLITIGYSCLSMGSSDSALVDFKLLFATLLLSGANSFVLCHNHPSGSVEPSKEDTTITNEIKKIARFHKITFLDHLIISKTKHYSFADEGKV